MRSFDLDLWVRCMSKYSGWERFYREDLPHAVVAGILSSLNYGFHLLPIPLDVAVTSTIGYLRERVQMLMKKDTIYGRNRQRDALGFAVGSILVDLVFSLVF